MSMNPTVPPASVMVSAIAMRARRRGRWSIRSILRCRAGYQPAAAFRSGLAVDQPASRLKDGCSHDWPPYKKLGLTYSSETTG